MIRSTKILAAALALGTLALSAVPDPAAAAARVVVCAPRAPASAAGPSRVVNPNTTTAYVLNNQGCAAVSSADYGYFSSQGYTLGANLFSIAKTAITAQDFTSLVLPVGAYIQGVVIRETAGNQVNGGIKLGTTAGGTDISAGITVGASGLSRATDVSLSKRAFSATASQAVSVDAVVSWGSASVDVTIFYSLF